MEKDENYLLRKKRFPYFYYISLSFMMSVWWRQADNHSFGDDKGDEEMMLTWPLW